VEELGEKTMNLAVALGLKEREMVSLIGAGGKTTLLFRLAKELRDGGAKVLATTTTKIFKPTKPHVDRLFLVEDPNVLLSTTSQIQAPAIIAVGHNVDDDGKLLGLPSTWLDQLEESQQFDAILVEADGAASRLFKVPSELEPVVPDRSHLTAWNMAIKILGKPLQPNWVHRAERAITLLNATPETPVTKELIVRLLEHPLGCLKGIPPGSRKAAVLNQADSPEEIEQAKDLGRSIARFGFERVVITSHAGDAPIKAMISN
jgi:probable selenium-dependent hydroxylase accessory protein YqeC